MGAGRASGWSKERLGSCVNLGYAEKELVSVSQVPGNCGGCQAGNCGGCRAV